MAAAIRARDDARRMTRHLAPATVAPWTHPARPSSRQLVRQGPQASAGRTVPLRRSCLSSASSTPPRLRSYGSPSIRYQVEQRLAASYEAQVEPLEMASGDLERDLATLEPQHRRIVELIGSRTRRRADLGRLSARHHQAGCRLGARDRGARCVPGRARVARQAPLVLGAGDGSPRPDDEARPCRTAARGRVGG